MMSFRQPCRLCGTLTKSKYGHCSQNKECRAAGLRELRRTTHQKKKDRRYNQKRLRLSYGSLSKWVQRKLSGWKCTAEKRGLEFSLSFDDVPLTDTCSVTGVRFDLAPGVRVANGRYSNHPSLDRVNPRQGYIPGNVRLVTQSYNTLKSCIEHYDGDTELLVKCLIADVVNWGRVQPCGDIVELGDRDMSRVEESQSYEWESIIQPELF